MKNPPSNVTIYFCNYCGHKVFEYPFRHYYKGVVCPGTSTPQKVTYTKAVA
jgi:hypothetical protein